ncbi:MAG: hypothetical protein LBH46_01755 [Rickettsiales bacterium]|jgi:hypothetical protein|nr:hypothetical protein [Rickettsiales bacterium]
MKTSTKYNSFTGITDKQIQGRVDSPLYFNSVIKCKNFILNKFGGFEKVGAFTISNINNSDFKKMKELYFYTFNIGISNYILCTSSTKDSVNPIIFKVNLNGELTFLEFLTFEASLIKQNYNKLCLTNDIASIIVTNENFRPIEIYIQNSGGKYFNGRYITFTKDGDDSDSKNKFIPDKEGNYPSKALIYNNRLILIGNKNKYDFLAVSNFNNYYKFSFYLKTNSLYNVELYAWIKSYSYMTSPTLYVIQSSDFFVLFTSNEIILTQSLGSFVPETTQNKVSNEGCSDLVEPFIYQNAVLFVSKDGIFLKTIKKAELSSNNYGNAFAAQIINEYTYNYTRDGIKSIAKYNYLNTLILITKTNKILNLVLDFDNGLNMLSEIDFEFDKKNNIVFNYAFESKTLENYNKVYISMSYSNYDGSSGNTLLKYNYNLLPELNEWDFRKYYKYGSLKPEELSTIKRQQQNDMQEYYNNYNKTLKYLNCETHYLINAVKIENNSSSEQNNNKVIFQNNKMTIGNNAVLKNYDGSIKYTIDDYINKEVKIVKMSKEASLVDNLIYSDNYFETHKKINDREIEIYNRNNFDFSTINISTNDYYLLFDVKEIVLEKDFPLLREKISIIGDNRYLGEFKPIEFIESGQRRYKIDLTNYNVAVIKYGYKNNSLFVTNSMGYDFEGQTTQTTIKHINSVVLRLNNSLGGYVGTDLFKMSKIMPYENNNQILSKEQIPINFDVEVKIDDISSRGKNVIIYHDTPQPFNCNFINVKMEAEV